MKMPYQHLLVCSDILVAARGGHIYTFNIRDGSHIGSYRHPSLEKHCVSKDAGTDPSKSLDGAASQEQGDTNGGGPALKRRKVTLDDDEEPGTAEDQIQRPETDSHGNGEGQNRQKRKKGIPGAREIPESPFITCLEATADSRYVVAVTGQDKNIQVFEHDGKGNLKKLSDRYAFSRPSGCDLLTHDAQEPCLSGPAPSSSRRTTPPSSQPTSSATYTPSRSLPKKALGRRRNRQAPLDRVGLKPTSLRSTPRGTARPWRSNSVRGMLPLNPETLSPRRQRLSIPCS